MIFRSFLSGLHAEDTADSHVYMYCCVFHDISLFFIRFAC